MKNRDMTGTLKGSRRLSCQSGASGLEFAEELRILRFHRHNYNAIVAFVKDLKDI